MVLCLLLEGLINSPKSKKAASDESIREAEGNISGCCKGGGA